MQVVTQPVFVPGCCLVCGISERPWFFDLQMHAEFWGNIYFCSECFGQMAGTAQWGDVQQHVNRVNELEMMCQELYKKVDVYESALADIVSISIVPNSFDSERVAHIPIDSTAHVSIDTEPTGEEGPTESSDDEGVDELRSSEGARKSVELQF